MTNMQNNTDENFNEDFERLMKQFLSEEYKDVKLDDMQTEEDDDISTGSPLPGDVIEQNQNTSVRVEILRLIDIRRGNCRSW